MSPTRLLRCRGLLELVVLRLEREVEGDQVARDPVVELVVQATSQGPESETHLEFVETREGEECFSEYGRWALDPTSGTDIILALISLRSSSRIDYPDCQERQICLKEASARTPSPIK